MMITDIVDVATAVVTSARALVPNPIHHLFNMADSALAAVTGFLFIYYVYAYSSMKHVSLIRRNVINAVLLGIDLLLLLTNPLTGLVFTYDEEGNYIHEALFTPVAYGFPILFFLIASLYMLTHRERYKKSQLTSLVLAMVLAGTLFVLQMLFFDDVLITFFITSIGSLVVFLSLETPEYEKLIHTEAELNEAKEREAVMQAKERLSREVMTALSKAVDAKDHYTNGHSERVAIHLLAMIDEDTEYKLRENHENKK